MQFAKQECVLESLPNESNAVDKKVPSEMDVAPWNVHWIKMVLDGIEWY